MSYTPEEIDARFAGEDPGELSKAVRRYLDASKDYKARERGEIRNARGFVYGDEWTKAGNKLPDGDKLSLRIPKQLVDLIVSEVLREPLSVELRPENLPTIDESLVAELQSMSTILAVPSQSLAELIGELKTHEAAMLLREMGAHEIARQWLEHALVDRWAALKIQPDPHANARMRLRVVSLDSFTGDPYARDWSELEFMAEELVLSPSSFAAQFPWVVDSYQRRGVIESLGSFLKGKWASLTGKAEDSDFVQLPDTAKADGQRMRIREIYLRDYSEVQDPALDEQGQPILNMDGSPALLPPRFKFPGGWKRLYYFNGEVISSEPLPGPVKHPPYYPLTPKRKTNDWRGSSLIYDLHDTIIGLDKAASMALANLIESGNNLRLWNPSALENPESVQSITPGIRDVVLRPGNTFAEAVFESAGTGVNPAVFSVFSMLDGLLQRAAGTGTPTQGPDGQEVQADGFTTSTILTQVKSEWERLGADLALLSIEYVDAERNIALVGEDTVSVRFNPAALAPLLEMGTRFRCYATVTEPLPSEPSERVEAIVGLTEAAAKLSAATGMPLSTTLAITRPPGAATLLRQLKRQEIQKSQGDAGPSPEEAARLATRENALQSAVSEIFKKAWQTMASDPTQAGRVISMLESGYVRAALEKSVAPPPPAPQEPPPGGPGAMAPEQAPPIPPNVQ